MAMSKDSTNLRRAAKAIKQATALIITAGAGMSVDSGLPDYRGPQGFWKAYPLLKDKGIKFVDMCTPKIFDDDPEFAWGFFGHLFELYTKTKPHRGFQILKSWALSKEKGYFVYTSNVDGHFLKAGFSEDNIVECHGSIHFLQCTDPEVSREIWPTPKDQIKGVDMATLRMSPPLPHGPPGAKKQVLARPNVLMFDDWLFVGDRSYDQQEARFNQFYERLEPLDFVIIEIGAGTAVPTIRYKGETLAEQFKGATLIRLNPTEPEVPDKIKQKCVSLPMKGLEALQAIDKMMK